MPTSAEKGHVVDPYPIWGGGQVPNKISVRNGLK